LSCKKLFRGESVKHRSQRLASIDQLGPLGIGFPGLVVRDARRSGRMALDEID
jgi:hypothetical protein